MPHLSPTSFAHQDPHCVGCRAAHSQHGTARGAAEEPRRQCVHPGALLRQTYCSFAAEVPGLQYRFVLGTSGLPAGGAAILEAEQAASSDLVLLAGARDGERRHLSEKVLHWFVYASEAFASAEYVAKTDQDVLAVWPRIAWQLHRHRQQALAPTLALIGRIEWASYQRHEGRFCGCCGYTREHALKTLQFEPRANFGSCALDGRHKTAQRVFARRGALPRLPSSHLSAEAAPSVCAPKARPSL